MQRTTESEQLDAMSDRELSAYWNILQFRTAQGTVLVDAEDKTARHVGIVGELLTGRGIRHEAGKIIAKLVRV